MSSALTFTQPTYVTHSSHPLMDLLRSPMGFGQRMFQATETAWSSAVHSWTLNCNGHQRDSNPGKADWVFGPIVYARPSKSSRPPWFKSNWQVIRIEAVPFWTEDKFLTCSGPLWLSELSLSFLPIFIFHILLSKTDVFSCLFPVSGISTGKAKSDAVLQDS